MEAIAQWRNTARPVVRGVRFCLLPAVVLETFLQMRGCERLRQHLLTGLMVVGLPVTLFLTGDHIEDALCSDSRWKRIDKGSKTLSDLYRIGTAVSILSGVDLGLKGQLSWWILKGQRTAFISPAKLGIAVYALATCKQHTWNESGYQMLTAVRYSFALLYAGCKGNACAPQTILPLRLISSTLLTVRVAWKMA